MDPSFNGVGPSPNILNLQHPRGLVFAESATKSCYDFDMCRPIARLVTLLSILLAACAPGLAAPTPQNTPSATQLPTKTTAPSPTTQPRVQSIPDLLNLEDVLTVEEYKTGIDELDAGALAYAITYLSDGYTVEGYISAPIDYLEKEEAYPVLVYNRGGNADFGAVNSNMPPNLAISFQAIVLASQYRETRGGNGKDEFGGADVRDIIKLIDLVGSCPFIDHDHVVMWGESRGSIMTFEILRVDDRIDAAIVDGSVPDLVAVYNFRNQDMQSMLDYRVGGSPEEVPEEYTKRSAIQWADEINVPLLVFHTEDDLRAPIEPVDEFVALLQSLGKEVTYVRQAKGGHCWNDLDMIMDFFAEHTRDG